MDFSFTRDECLNLERSLRLEWLETDGLGGYAASTVLDCHTRKYHGMLVSPVASAGGSFVFLSKVEASILTHGKTFRFSTNKYPGVFNPTGHKYIERFHHEYHPTVRYRVGDIQLRRSLMMVHGEPTVLLKYELIGSEVPVKLQLRPLLAFRNIHDVSRENDEFDSTVAIMDDGSYKVTPYDHLPSLYLDASMASSFQAEPVWLQSMEYLKERSRGFAYQEDLHAPGVVELELQSGDIVFFRASLRPPEASPRSLWTEEHERRERRYAEVTDEPDMVRILKARSGQFLIRNSHNQASVVAGYPWFGEWGRDAMISLPGLTLSRGEHSLALAVLTTYANQEKDGLLPNVLPVGEGAPSYNSVDSALWLFWAVQKYLAATGDLDQIRARLYPTMRRCIEAYIRGDAPDVQLMENGLLWVGDESTQLTWMDARVDGKPVTPRHGMAVEINALWYNALCFHRELAGQLGEEAGADIANLIATCRDGFVKTFWLPEAGHLADVVNNRGIDDAVRPNQIFAVSLPFSPLNTEQKRSVMRRTDRDLVTPYGLRTLSPGHPDYCPIYHGTPVKRDRAYHQGTVWPWLIGHFVEASLSIADDRELEKERLLREFMPLFDSHLRMGCLGSISEIFNADPPHILKGCAAQAWSVAEAIRAWDLLNEGGEA